MMGSTKRFWAKQWQLDAWAGLLLTALALALIGANVMLLRQNRELKQALQIRSEPTYLSPGRSVVRLRGLDLSGSRLSFDFDGGSKKTVMLVFQPECGWCQKNMDNWAALLDRSDRERFDFLAISTSKEGVADYVHRHRRLAALPLIAEPDINDRLEYRLFDTPQTIVVDAEGRVEKVWLGAMSGPVQQDVESYFGISLPGITD